MNKYKYRNILLAVVTAAAFGGCTKTEEFLEVPDSETVDAKIWEEEGAVQFFLADTYESIIPQFPYQFTGNNYNIHLVSDENYFSANDNWGKKVFNFNGQLIANDIRYVGAKYQGSNYGDNRYFDVAKCNLAIKNLPGSSISDTTKKKLLGQFYALRAFMYLEMMKIYGGMPLVLEPQNPANVKVEGRVKAKVMFEQIIKDLDLAMENLKNATWNAGDGDATGGGRINYAGAAALKARAWLYWASPQFNPTDDPKHPFDQSRWDGANKAAKEAYDICIASGKALMQDYKRIFRMEGAANTEAIIVRPYATIYEKRGNDVETKSRPGDLNGSPNDVYFVSKIQQDAYTMLDGTPITQTEPGDTYEYNDLLFWKDRDPRFEASLAYNGGTWSFGIDPDRVQWTYVNAFNGVGKGDHGAVYCKRFYSPDLPLASVKRANDVGGSGMDWIELRFAEVILTYAETANETNNLSLAKDLVRQIRDRAGIEMGSKDYGLALANNKEEMRDLIMNERQVEFAFEGKRGDDLRRTRRMHKLTGMLNCLRITPKGTLGTFLNTPMEIDPAKLNRDTIDMSNEETINRYFNYELTTINGNGVFNMPEYYYFFGLSNFFINSSALLEETIGWPGGTFDPL